jgi:hypothetical protein
MIWRALRKRCSHNIVLPLSFDWEHAGGVLPGNLDRECLLIRNALR